MKSFYEFYKQVKEDTLGMKDPIPLSKVPLMQAAVAVNAGLTDGNPQDDVVQVGQYSGPAVDLKPSQKEIILVKAFNMAMNSTPCGGKFPPGGDLGSVVSQDNYIMDGHHRWAATLLVEPGASIKAAQINLPGDKVVSLLNVYTASKGIKGNAGEGEVSQFTGDNIQRAIIDVAEQSGKSPDSPDGKAPGFNWQDLQAKIAQFGGGDFNAGLAKLKANADNMPKQLPPWAPNRVDMPVVQPNELPDLIEKLKSGTMDHEEPLSPNAKSSTGLSSNGQPGQPSAPAPGAAPAVAPAAGAPATGVPAQQMQAAWNTNYGMTMMEQAMVLSGLATLEQIEIKRNRK